MRSLVQVLFAFAIALAVLIALILVLPIQVIKMLAGSESQAADNPRRKAELVQH